MRYQGFIITHFNHFREKHSLLSLMDQSRSLQRQSSVERTKSNLLEGDNYELYNEL